ncbi:MAG: archaeosine biosynthesis radical SAM protein RaSEA [Candidatus Lokiarchaeota archaeon]|nr:archaeosine biosynthesis radical SAM protein RaSEA [Candidatus Lokiarchaeota archaeon]
MKKVESDLFLLEKIKHLRQRALNKRSNLRPQALEQPISFWLKKDRLLNEIGQEFTIILRTKGCSWSLGESGGCTMCGYIQDANIENVNSGNIIKQFDYAFNSKIKEINSDEDNFSLKVFNSGSFFDENEISDEARLHIYEKIEELDKIKEVVIESRIEYITSDRLTELKDNLKNKHIEIAIGVETVNDYIRNHYINKGMLFNDFKTVLNICKENNIGVKTYLLLKPPFLNEQGAIDDCISSINNLIDLGVNTISINPVNIQKGTLVESLYMQNRYRPPWYYSLFKVLKKSLDKDKLKHTRILSDPSGASTKRGIHNCLKRECEKSSLNKLREFVLSQDLNVLDEPEYECGCKRQYQFEKLFH